MEYQTARTGGGPRARGTIQSNRSAASKRRGADRVGRGARTLSPVLAGSGKRPRAHANEPCACLFEEVTVHKAEQMVAHLRFKGGATQTLTVALPPPFAQSRLTAPETLAAIDRFLDEYTDAEIAEHLNQEGYRTFDGLRFHSMHVYQLRRD